MTFSSNNSNPATPLSKENDKQSQSSTTPLTEKTQDQSVHVCLLPDNVTDGLRELASSADSHVILVSALRILDFRRRGFESSPISVLEGDKNATVRKFDITVTGDTLVEHVTQAVRIEIANLLQADYTDQISASVDAENSSISWLFSAKAATECSLVYDSAQYAKSIIQSLASQFLDVVYAVLCSPQVPINAVTFSGVLRQLRHMGHPLRAPTFQNLPESLVDGLNEVISVHGSQIAITQGNFVCLYKDLDVVSTLLASELLSQRGPDRQSDDMIAYCIPPSPMAIITMLAIVKTGCAYVPIDVRQAEDRAISMLDTLGNPCVVTSADSPSFVRSSAFKSPTFDITQFFTSWQSEKIPMQSKPLHVPQRSNVACVLFTSGTTGTPKGVRITHKNILALAADKESMPFLPSDRVAQINNLAWDAHIVDVWCALLRGAAVVSFSRFDVLDPAVLTRQFNIAQISSCLLSTTFFRHMLANNPEVLLPLRVLLTGGEMGRYADFTKAKVINPNLTIQNLYGPTEACVCVTSFPVKMSSDFPQTGTIPAGLPIDGAQIVLLDNQGQIVPPGVIGEINIRGAGVADGYLKEQETKASFIERHIPGLTETLYTFYRTGDLGRWNHTGQLEIMGRVNSNQIKIRGQRLEVDEVEAKINGVAGMKDVAIAYHRPRNHAHGRLIGYVVPGPDSEHYTNKLKTEAVLVEAWEQHYDSTYSQVDVVKIRKEFLGWDSMITGQPIPHEEMQEWLDDTCRPFLQYKPRKVFEIGCGIGIVLYKMIKDVEHFYGIEPSGAAVQQLKKQLTKDGFGARASIWHAPADQLPNIPDFEADMIVVNSVAQYFPSLAYFRTVVSNAVSRCRPGGHIVLGDMRSAPLQDLLVLEILQEQWKNSLSEKTLKSLRDEVHKRQQHATELLVDPTFFFDLQREDARITHVEVVPKAISYDNELSRYRYQVILHIDGEPTPHHSYRWSLPDAQHPGFENLPQLLKEFIASDSLFLALGRIPNRILQAMKSMVEAVSATSTLDRLPVSTLLSTKSPDLRGFSAYDLENLAKAHGLNVKISCARQSEEGILDAVFTKREAQNPLIEFPAPIRSSVLQINKDRESNYPRTKLNQKSWDEIKSTLIKRLPDFMIPDILYAVEHIPVTLNGKTDRKIIARMAASDCDLVLQKTSEASISGCRTEAERIICQYFARFLGCHTVSPSTNFFDEGGHSLLATQLRNALQKEFSVSIPLMQLYETPTPEKIAVTIGAAPKTDNVDTNEIAQNTDLEETHDLSHAQFRLWFLDQLHPGDAWYNSPLVLRSEEPLDEEVMERTIGTIVDRHDILRTIFIQQNGCPKAVIIKEKPKLKILDIVGVEDIEMVRSIVLEHGVRAFDLSLEPAFKPTLFRWRSQHILLISLHHIITDGFSHNIWRKELASVYSALLKNEPIPLSPLPIQYQDYARWQHSTEHEELVRPQLAYWLNYLKGSKPARFPIDFERQDSLSSGATHTLVCKKALKEKLDAICAKYRVTWFMLLLAVFRGMHFQTTGQVDGSFGTPIANRHRTELEPLLGFFVNTQVLRLRCHQGMSFLSLLSDTKEHSFKAHENQDVPFDSLVQALKPERSIAQNPLVEIMFAFQTQKTQPFDMGGISLKTFGTDTKTSRFDLEVHWSERPDELRCVFFYRQAVFKKETIEKISEDLLELLEKVADDPKINLVTDKEYFEITEEEAPIEEQQSNKAVAVNGPDGPPLNETETQICEIFEQVLETGPITRQSNFFQTGGHSLLVSLVCSKITDLFGISVGVREVFRSPTPASLSDVVQSLLEIESAAQNGSSEKVEENLPTHFVYKEVPHKPLVFCVPTVTGLGDIYSQLAKASRDFTVVALNDPFLRGIGLIGERNPSTFTLTDLAELFYETIVGLDKDMSYETSAVNEDRPLNILGYSFGGNVAIEIARFARDDGRKVNLFLVDCADSSVVLDSGRIEVNYGDLPQHLYQETVENSINLAYDIVAKDTDTTLHGGVYTKAQLSNLRTCMAANHHRLFNHKSAYYPGSAVMFRSDGNAFHGLHRKFDSLEEIALEGNHFSLLQHSMGQLDLLIDRIAMGVN